MGDIYRNATKVLIWLGEKEGETDNEIIIDLLQNVYHLFIAWGENNNKKQIT
jgi:hypothetical protein